LIERGTRTADVIAETPVVCYRLSRNQAEAMRETPELRLKIIEALARDLADRLRQANTEIAALAS
jgi:CRP-like cAMP-binding protein